MGNASFVSGLILPLGHIEGRMNSHQATYETALERFERRMAEYNAEFAKRNAEAAKRGAERDAEFAKRDKDNLRRQIGLWVATVVVIGVLIRWPG